jgi:hypothetical protein
VVGSLLERLVSLRGDEVGLAVFADELVEDGDLRGEYLALVRAVDRLPHWQREWSDATYERKRIQAEVQRAWRDSGALDDLPGALQVSLAGGLPTRLNGPCAALTQSRPFPLSQAIRTLDLTTVSPDLTTLLALPWLGQIKDLFLLGGPRYGDSVESQDEELRALLTSPQTAGLERLSCQLPQSFSAKILLDARFLGGLKHLDLFPSEAASLIDPAAFLTAGPLPLEELILRNASLTYAAVTGLGAHFKSLTRLRLTAAELSAGGLSPLLGGLPNLRRLELSDVDLDWEALADLFESGFAPALESVELYQLRRTRKARHSPGFARCVAALARRPIAHLKWNRVDLSLYDLETFVESGLLAKVDTLGLDDNLIGELGVQRLARSEAPNLKALTLSWCGFTNLGAVTQAKWLPQLHLLELHQNELEDDALSEMLKGRVLPNLRSLRMPSDHRIRVDGHALPRLVSVEPQPPAHEHFAALLAGTAPPLDTLRVEAATDEQLFALAASPHARAIRKLELKITPHVSDTGIEALVTSEHLGGVLDFNLRYPQVSQKSHRAINERFGFPQFAQSDPWRE